MRPFSTARIFAASIRSAHAASSAASLLSKTSAPAANCPPVRSMAYCVKSDLYELVGRSAWLQIQDHSVRHDYLSPDRKSDSGAAHDHAGNRIRRQRKLQSARQHAGPKRFCSVETGPLWRSCFSPDRAKGPRSRYALVMWIWSMPASISTGGQSTRSSARVHNRLLSRCPHLVSKLSGIGSLNCVNEHQFSDSDPLFPKTRVGVGPQRGFAALGIDREPGPARRLPPGFSSRRSSMQACRRSPHTVSAIRWRNWQRTTAAHQRTTKHGRKTWVMRTCSRRSDPMVLWRLGRQVDLMARFRKRGPLQDGDEDDFDVIE